METSKRNKPATLIIVSVAVIVLLIVFYFVTLSRKVCKLKSLGLDFIILAFLQK